VRLADELDYDNFRDAVTEHDPGAFRAVNRLARPFIERRASRLWVEDCAYAQRLYELRVDGARREPDRPLNRTAAKP
jgi:hypothetical protein